ncbi:beta-lactamase family protein [Bradyrhizobium sp. 190]|nr:beta-lactamase family protein [Bradyrhizobium sp. 190]
MLGAQGTMSIVPADEGQITLANWRQHPQMEWSYRNVREVLPTANIARSSTPVALPRSPRYLDEIPFADLKGEKRTVADALRSTHVDGFLVLHRGRTVTEWYAHGLAPDAQHLIFSVSKSIAGTVGGILTGQGRLDPEAPVVRYLPELKASVYGGCTVRHLLDMSVSEAD